MNCQLRARLKLHPKLLRCRRTEARNVTSYDRVVKSLVDASGPLEAGGTFSGPGCITSQREFSAAGWGAMNDDLDAIRRVLAADVESFRRLVERYQRPLLTLVRNLSPPETEAQNSALRTRRAKHANDRRRRRFERSPYSRQKHRVVSRL